MSYESEMLEQFNMPTRQEVEECLLQALLTHGGVIKEFGPGQEIVDEMANYFGLSDQQSSAFLQTIYRKENRPKKAYLWHRLLFRAISRKSMKILLPSRSELYLHRNAIRWHRQNVFHQ